MTILIACGMRTEAAILNNPAGAVVVQGRDNDVDLAIDLEAAIAKGGIAGVMSVGVSGALAPDLAAGDVVVASEVVSAGVPPYAASAFWSRAILRALGGTGASYRARSGSFGYSSSVVATAADKAALRAKTGADAVDMETWIAASVAFKHRLPFAAVRTISDPADFDLPPAALAAMTPSGSINVKAVFRSVLTDSDQIPALLKLDAYSGRAFDNLAAALLQIGVGMGFPTEVTS